MTAHDFEDKQTRVLVFLLIFNQFRLKVQNMIRLDRTTYTNLRIPKVRMRREGIE